MCRFAAAGVAGDRCRDDDKSSALSSSLLLLLLGCSVPPRVVVLFLIFPSKKWLLTGSMLFRKLLLLRGLSNFFAWLATAPDQRLKTSVSSLAADAARGLLGDFWEFR